MATIKSYTDLEQSKKLSEILPLESADMLYYCNKSNNTQISQYPFIRSFKEKDTFSYLPCWSLAALLSVLNFPSLTQNKEDEWEVCVFDHNNDDYIKKIASNPVDVCYEIIIRLNELKML